MRYQFVLSILSLTLIYCSPKGPQTFNSPLIGKTKATLIETKGNPTLIKKMDNSQVYIYAQKEAYFGKGKPTETKPKKIFNLEYIYYIDENDKVYKYQVWRRELK